MSPEAVALALGILGVGAFIKSSAGFGDALVAMPLLALFVDVKTAAPIVALFSTTTTVIVLWHAREHVDVASAGRLVVAAAIAMPFGVMTLRFVDDVWLKLALAALVLGFALWKMAGGGGDKGEVARRPVSERLAWPFGFCSGFFGGAFNITGPPIIAFGLLRGWPKDRMRGTLQGFFICTNLLIVGAHAAGGLWTREVFRVYLIGLPLLAVGNLLGFWAARRMSARVFERVIVGLIALAGGLLLLEAVRTLAS